MAAFGLALLIPAWGVLAADQSANVVVAAAIRTTDAGHLELPLTLPETSAEAPQPAMVAQAPAPEPDPAAPPRPAPVAAVPVLPPPATEGPVVASWYGPGFYGNRTACGQVYTPEVFGVAHRTLPCGILVAISYGAKTLVVPVIDRGPYVAGRTLDLSNATRNALGCSDLCTVSMQLAR